MLDTKVQVSNELTFNSVAGTLVRSTSESKFIRFHMNSTLADRFFDISKPYKKKLDSHPYTTYYVEVLQVMLCGGDNFLVEYLDIIESK